jgi:ComF family protein
VHEAKFHHNLHAITLLGVLFKVYLDGLPKREASIIVPIPLAPARLRMRGYNQVHEIVKSVELRSVAIDTTSLVRTRNTKPQSELPKEARERNIAGAFTVKYPERITKCHVILVDDVATTGATMRAAKAALLLHHPASIKCIALAH